MKMEVAMNGSNYRINGFKQIEAFFTWVFNNADKEIKPHHISLYMFLLMQNNRRGWVEWFQLPYEDAIEASCIGSRGTYYKVLHDLHAWGLIDYVPGINKSKAPKISIIQLSENGLVPIPLPAPLPVPVPVPLPIPVVDPINNIVSSNIEQVSSNGQTQNLPNQYLTEYQLEQVAKNLSITMHQAQQEMKLCVDYYNGEGKKIPDMYSKVLFWIGSDKTKHPDKYAVKPYMMPKEEQQPTDEATEEEKEAFLQRLLEMKPKVKTR